MSRDLRAHKFERTTDAQIVHELSIYRCIHCGRLVHIPRTRRADIPFRLAQAVALDANDCPQADASEFDTAPPPDPLVTSEETVESSPAPPPAIPMEAAQDIIRTLDEAIEVIRTLVKNPTLPEAWKNAEAFLARCK